MAVAPDVRTTLLDGSSLHRVSPASSRPPEFPPLGGLRAGLWRPPQVAPGPVEVAGGSPASADGARRSCPNARPEGPGVRTVPA